MIPGSHYYLWPWGQHDPQRGNPRGWLGIALVLAFVVLLLVLQHH